jgi:hypothetical protein
MAPLFEKKERNKEKKETNKEGVPANISKLWKPLQEGEWGSKQEIKPKIPHATAQVAFFPLCSHLE